MQVVSLAEKGKMAGKIEEAAINVRSLNMKAGRFSFRAFSQLLGIIREEKPDLIHCWMYHANLFGGLAGWLTGIPTLWGIHHHSADNSHLKPKTVFVIRLGALLSRIPQKILFVSKSSRKAHNDIGFDAKRSIIIPNGVDTAHFNPDPKSCNSLRKKLGIPSRAMVVGHVGRFDPAKDHETFINTAAGISEELPETHFILCGKNITKENSELLAWINKAGIKSAVHLIGEQLRIEGIYPAFDLLIQSSRTEAFPLALVEAMACGVPCVATDVGDSAVIIGESGRLVRAGDSRALAHEAISLLSDKELLKKLGAQARQRIIENFQITRISKSMESLYEDVIGHKLAGKSK